MNKPDPTHDLTKENLLLIAPPALAHDPSMAALEEIAAEALEMRLAETDRARIYPDIHRLDEKLLDILAYDFKVDWWDPDYTVEEKRRTLADNWRVHRTLGTKAAVETALRAIYPKAAVQEWFEYGGEPYCFKLNIDLTGEASDATRPWRALERVNFYKSLRSHTDEITFTFNLPPATINIGGGMGAQTFIGAPLQPDRYDFRDMLHMGGYMGARTFIGAPLQTDKYDFRDMLHTGGCFGAQPVVEIPQERDNVHFQDALHAGGGFSGRTVFPVPEDPAQPTSTTILRFGGVCTIISNLSQED